MIDRDGQRNGQTAQRIFILLIVTISTVFKSGLVGCVGAGLGDADAEGCMLELCDCVLYACMRKEGAKTAQLFEKRGGEDSPAY